MSDSLPYGFPPPHRPDPGTGKPVDRDNRPFYPVFGGPLHGRTMRWGGQELLQVPANMRETPRPVGGPGIVADQQTATRMVTYQRRAVGYGWPEMGIDVRCYYLALEHLPAQQTDRLGLIHGFDRMYDTMSLPANVDPATTLAPYVKANHDDGTRIDTGGPMQLYRSAKMVRAAAIAEVQQTNTDGLIRYACKVIWPPMTFTLRPGQDGRAPERERHAIRDLIANQRQHRIEEGCSPGHARQRCPAARADDPRRRPRRPSAPPADACRSPRRTRSRSCRSRSWHSCR